MLTAEHRCITRAREEAALAAYHHAMRKNQTWRHAVRDSIAASDAADEGRVWKCPVCGATNESGKP